MSDLLDIFFFFYVVFYRVFIVNGVILGEVFVFVWLLVLLKQIVNQRDIIINLHEQSHQRESSYVVMF